MSQPKPAPADKDELAKEWGVALFGASCPHCGASFLVPADAGAPVCPNCLAARLEPQPLQEHDLPPELVLPFTISDALLSANLERWQRAIPFRPATLNPRDLSRHLVRLYLPLYLADARVWGTWRAQMGFDYLVASSEERYDGKGWVTQRLNETRVRWEARAGDITRKYENLPAPALEKHAQWMGALGAGAEGEPPFDTSRAAPYDASVIARAIVRSPDIAPNAAWDEARRRLERRAAGDCQLAAGAQHEAQFQLRGAYGEPTWTLLLLPVYVTYYEGDDARLLPVRINGQTGFVSGVKRASRKRAVSWAVGIVVLALALFVLTVGVSVAALQMRELTTWAILLLLGTLGLLLVAPLPLIVAWQYNRHAAQEETP